MKSGCTVFFNGFCRLCFICLRILLRCFISLPFSRLLRAALLCWFPLSFATCFGLHGHLHVCRILHIFKDSASLLFFAAFFTCPSACCSIVCWFPLCFTTCFGLHGHLHGCRILHIFKTSASLLFSLPFSHVLLRAALLYVGFHCVSLHVSAYMAIFRGV
jgi:hypothetical protein